MIVQNFRAKPDTAMAHDPDADLDDLAATMAVARLVLGPEDAAPGPAEPRRRASSRLLLRAGIDDWGGVSPVTADHVNPERPWPAIDELAARSAEAGFALRERLTVYPRYVAGRLALDRPAAARARRRAGRPGDRAGPGGRRRRWAGRGRSRTAGSPPRAGSTCNATIDTTGRTADRRGDFASVYGDWEVAARRARRARGTRARSGWTATSAPGCGWPTSTRPRCSTPRTPTRPWRCSSPTARRWRSWPARPTTCAATPSATTSPTWSTATSTSPTSATSAAGSARSPSASATPTRSGSRWTRWPTGPAEAAEDGATEVCMQGGIDPQLPVTVYADLVRAVRAAVPGMHVHAFSPDGDRVRGGQGRGVDRGLAHRAARGRAGHHPRHRRRDPRRRGPLGADQGQAAGGAWVEVVSTAHGLGHPVELDDDVRPRRPPAALARALPGAGRHPGPHRRLHRVRGAAVRAPQRADLPGRHRPARADLAGEPGRARDGPAALHGRIDNIQCSWVKLGDALAADMLRGGATTSAAR